MAAKTITADFAAIPPIDIAGVRSTSQTKFKPVGENTTDLVYQVVKLYIEGIEVPFMSMSISQAISQLPTCEFEIPPEAGLMEISRYYQPKVHIFYTDADRGGDRLLFWGHIVGSSYQKSRSGSGSASIRFRCRHRNQLAQQILLRYTGISEQTAQDAGNMGSFNSIQSITEALSGITGVQEDPKDLLGIANKDIVNADVSKLDAKLIDFENRLIGLPSVVVNLWNQLKRMALHDPESRLNLLAMYIPMFEQGLSYLKRLSGHYSLEKQQQDSKAPVCPEVGTTKNVMIPPAYRTGSMAAVQSTMAVMAIKSGTGFSGEMTGFTVMCEQFYASIEYEMITLASPAEVNMDPRALPTDTVLDWSVVETVVKPQIPFYYSPVCNVIFPRMFDSISFDQDEENIPTRVVAKHPALIGESTKMSVNYRGPNTVRESQSLASVMKGRVTTPKEAKYAIEYDLRSTTGIDYNIPGKYEQGVGIKPVEVTIPWWIVMMAKKNVEAGGQKEALPEKDSTDYNNRILQMAQWTDRYGYDVVENDGQLIATRNFQKDLLNPYGMMTDIMPHERLLFASVDFEFSKLVARARTASVSCVFNPYIIPGYPMDVLDDSPNHPSFHGLCTSVTHSITSRSISTSVSMAATVTYAEMSNYYIPPVHPWLQSALGLLNGEEHPLKEGEVALYGDSSRLFNVKSTIIQNPEAKLKADTFYHSVLGVGAADPSTMYDYDTGRLFPQTRVGALLYANASGGERSPGVNGGENNDWFTTVGNLRMVSRNIESKDSIAEKFLYKFVDMDATNYSGGSIQYSNPFLGSSLQLEPGSSMFLDYMETETFLKTTKGPAPSPANDTPVQIP